MAAAGNGGAVVVDTWPRFPASFPAWHEHPFCVCCCWLLQATAMSRLNSLVSRVLLGGSGCWPGLVFRWGGVNRVLPGARLHACWGPGWAASDMLLSARYGAPKPAALLFAATPTSPWQAPTPPWPPPPLPPLGCSHSIVARLTDAFLNHYYSTGCIAQGLRVGGCVGG